MIKNVVNDNVHHVFCTVKKTNHKQMVRAGIHENKGI